MDTQIKNEEIMGIVPLVHIFMIFPYLIVGLNFYHVDHFQFDIIRRQNLENIMDETIIYRYAPFKAKNKIKKKPIIGLEVKCSYHIWEQRSTD